jgi:hypothetical protein
MTPAVIHRIFGDWLHNGYIDNHNCSRALEFAIVEGRPYVLAACDRPDLDAPIMATRGMLAWGGSMTFAPDPGEVERVGVLFPADQPPARLAV